MEEKKIKPNYKDSKVLRTYNSDVADAIRNDEGSIIKIALAEKEKRETEAIYKEAEGTKTSKVFLVIGGVILIVAAIVGSYFLFQKKKEKETPLPIPGNIETFITYNTYSYIDITDVTNTVELLDSIKKQESTDSGLIKALFLERKINDTSEFLTSNNFLSLIKASTPGALTRSLPDKYLLGKYSNLNSTNEQSKSAMFLILQISDYPQAYASMLDWEKTMLIDLYTLFSIEIIEPDDDNLFEKPWKDIIVNNKDTRVLYKDNGEAILYYVFINKNSLVITGNLEALKEIITRLIIKNT